MQPDKRRSCRRFPRITRRDHRQEVAMATKKRTTPKESPAPSPVEWYTVGTGFTERQLYRLNGPLCPEHQPIIKELSERHSSGRNAFDGTIAATEAAARQILKEAGLPSDPWFCYTIPDGEQVLSLEPIPGTVTLIDLVAARGYQERVDQVWYAAEILDLARTIREIAGKSEPWTALSLAAELGELVGEARALGFFQQAGAEGPPRRERTKSPWPTLADYLLRNYPVGNDEHRFDMVPDIKKDDDLPVGERHRFYRKNGRIHAEVQVKGEWKLARKTLKLSGLRRHLTEARKRKDR